MTMLCPRVNGYFPINAIALASSQMIAAGNQSGRYLAGSHVVLVVTLTTSLPEPQAACPSIVLDVVISGSV